MKKTILQYALAISVTFGTSAIAQEAKWIEVLKSGAPQFDKAAACYELSLVGTKAAVPALAALLVDEKLAHPARGALETIRGPSVDDALRDALGKVKGRLLEGVIGSIGVRRDAKAVPLLAPLLADSDAGVAQAAARALGSIGTSDAAKALDAALAGASGTKLSAVCEGIFRCAEQSPPADAIAVYDRLRGLTAAPHQIRAGALRGAVLLRKNDGIPLLLEAVRGADYAMTAAAARIAMELPGPEVGAALTKELPALPADKQVLIINALGTRGDAAAGPALLPLAAKASDEVRLAAVQNLTRLAFAPAVPVLAELAVAPKSDLAEAAKTCLASFPAKEADASIAGMLGHQDPKVRALALEMIAQRSAAAAIGSLLKAAEDPDASVRKTAMAMLRDQAGPAELQPLLALLLKAKESADIQAAARAISALCSRQSTPVAGKVAIIKAVYGNLSDGPTADVTKKLSKLVASGEPSVEMSNHNFGDPAPQKPKQFRVEYSLNGDTTIRTGKENETVSFLTTQTPPAIVDAICAAVGTSQGEAKCELLKTLRAVGGAKAFETVRVAVNDANPEAKDTALRALCEWPSADALPLLLEMAKSPPSKTMKVLALRGFVRLAPQQTGSDAEKLESLKAAMALADRDDEKRLIVGALANIPTLDALALAASHLENAALTEEAALAAVAIAEKLPAGNSEQLAGAMKEVAKRTKDKKLAGRANRLARPAKN